MDKDKHGSKWVGPFLLTRVLGKGSTGHVRLGVHKDTGLEVAIKIISKKLLSLEKDLKYKVEREIVILKLIKHPHVLSLIDVYESDHNLYLVLEYVEGGELFDYLTLRGRLVPSEALRFFQQIISAVDYCHHHFICHRDLKPENLLLDRHGKIRIADFGMASLQQMGALLDQSCGTPHYASPEVIRGIRYDGRQADVWSCGIILHALFTGTLPFDDDNTTKLLTKIKVGLFKMPQDIPVGVQSLLRRILTVNPRKRFNMKDIKESAWFQSNGLHVLLPEPPLYTHATVNLQLPSLPAGQLLDSDVLVSMHNLGCFSRQDHLLQALTAPESNLEKIVYYLLLERKVTQPATADEVHDEPCNSQVDVDSSTETIIKRTDTVVNLEDSLAQIGFLHRQNSIDAIRRRPRRPYVGTSEMIRSTSFSLVEMQKTENRAENLIPSNCNASRLSPYVKRRSMTTVFYRADSNDSDYDSDPTAQSSRSWFGELFNKSSNLLSVEVELPLENIRETIVEQCAAQQLECKLQINDSYKITYYPAGGSRPLVFQITLAHKGGTAMRIITLHLVYGFPEVFREVGQELYRALKSTLTTNSPPKVSGLSLVKKE